MDRLKGVGRLLAITGGMLLALRALHVGVPLVVPGTRPGPVTLATLSEVRGRTGFAPLVPGYRPAVLGERIERITVRLSPNPTVTIAWRGERFLVLTERRGGRRPAEPPVARPLAEVPGASWWRDGPRLFMTLRRGDLWVTVETDLPARDLRRLADTLTPVER